MPIEQTPPASGEIVKTLQLSSDAKSKEDIIFGRQVARYIQSTLGGNTSYYFIRNSRFAKNRSMIAGRYDMTRFMDMLQMNGKFNYVNINWLPFHIVNTIISRKVGAWMGRNEKIDVEAVDPNSLQLKNEQIQQAEFYIQNKEQVEALQQQSGVQIMPQQFQNLTDKDELDIWAQENNRLPEEIKYETGTNSILNEEGLFDVIKEKLLHDSGGVGFVGIYTWMDEKGAIHEEYVKPENAIYSYSEYPDFRDTAWRGRIVSKKISEIRKKYGVQFGGKLTEEEMFELAQKAKEYQVPDKIRWLSDWSYSLMRPYDEWNIDVIEFAYKSLDSDGFNMKVTKSGTLIMDKGDKPKLPEYKEYINDDGWNMYWGVYVRDADKMLEWGLMKNQIKAQDVKEIGNVEFPFSFYMYQNQDMRNVAIPEKIEKPFEQMMLILLQMEKLITRYKPPGAKVNVNSIRELDVGLANTMKPLDIEKHYEQTGIYYYTDLDAEGGRIADPITELANAGFRENALGLREMYMFWYQTLKDELGEDPNISTQAATPRVTEGNIQTSIQQADNATDYMYDAYLYVMEDAARKTACLLHDSVSFGAKAYRHLLGEDDVDSRIFSTKVRMLPTENEIAKLELQINEAIQSNPDLVMYLNTFKILRIAKEDAKLAEEYFRLGMKRMLQSKLQQQKDNQDATFNAQLQSGVAAEQERRKTEKETLKIKSITELMVGKERQKEIILTGIFGIYSKGLQMPTELKGLETEMVQNVALPLFAENISNIQQIVDAATAEPDEDAQQEQNQQQMQPQQNTQPA